jgi:tRNA-splicing ligase RtcB
VDKVMNVKLEPAGDCRWKIRRDARAGMRTEGLIIASPKLLPDIVADKAPEQVANVACLPGIVGPSIAMPDIHWGYGFAIGGVAAFSVSDGVVSPGGVGYDINCGVRLFSSLLTQKDIAGKEQQIASTLFAAIPSGVGSEGQVHLTSTEMKKVLADGARWAVTKGWGEKDDLDYTESEGRLEEADPDAVGPRPRERGMPQLGTLGSGNHFAEVGVVAEVLDKEIAATFGLEEGTITLMVHSGSRGLGHQVCEDYLAMLGKASARYGINLPDRQLAAVPIQSPEGKSYLGAMAAAANYAWANRQILGWLARQAIIKTLGLNPQQAGFAQVYDVAHNIAKFEEYTVDGDRQQVLVHRKGATRAFPAGNAQLPVRYRALGQPVLVPGEMGHASFVLVGTGQAEQEVFASACHGAGRRLSRHAAIKQARGRHIDEELARAGVVVMAKARGTLAEEMPEAYKDVSEVVDSMVCAGLARAVVRLRPLIVIKG